MFTSGNISQKNVQLQPDPLPDSLRDKIKQIKDPSTLMLFMGHTLRSMLQREKDETFLNAIRDAFIARAAGRPIGVQHSQACEILRVVIELRPEIKTKIEQDILSAKLETRSISWSGEDRRSQPLKDAAHPAINAVKPEPEALAAHYMAHVIEQKLSVFHHPQQQTPAMTYCHGERFFLFDTAFHNVFARFMTEVVMVLCQPILRRTVYTNFASAVNGTSDLHQAYLDSKRADIEIALTQRLAALAHLQKTAEELISQAEKSEGGQVLWREIEIPHVQSRSVSVFGVKLSMGSVTEKRKIKVRSDGGRDLSADEIEALTLYTQFTDMTSQEGIHLPTACNFEFLHKLMLFDPLKYAASHKGLVDLGKHGHTTQDFLREQVKRAEGALPSGFSDILHLSLFLNLSERSFGLAELHRVCIETTRDPIVLAQKRPLLHLEMAKRPRELAFQLRETLRTRSPVSHVDAALKLLFEAWRIFSKDLFESELNIAKGVIASFPIVFIGDANEKELTLISEQIVETLSAEKPEYDRCILLITTAYERLKQDRS